MNDIRNVLRVFSYNIHKGFALGFRRFVLKNIRDAIKSSGADLVLLQEVFGEHSEHAAKVADWPSTPQFEYLADSIWPHFAYGKNAVYDAGHHGNAILCRYPIAEWSNFNISTNPFENRGVLHCVHHLPDRKLRLHSLCVHLGLTRKGRKLQLQKILDIVESHIPDEEPLILAGDFNDWTEQAGQILADRLRLTEAFYAVHGKHPRTFPSRLPVLKLDRIYYRNLKVLRAIALQGKDWNKLSDHIPLLAEFEIYE